MTRYTPLQADVADRLDEINARLDEIDSQIDREACWNPTVDTAPADMELAEEYDKLLTEKQNCKRVLPDEEGSL